jgi:phosphomannomutase
LDLAEKEDFNFAEVDRLGSIEEEDFTDKHLDAVLALPAVDVEAIKAAHFTVVVDAVNSVGGIIMPRLLKRLGVKCIGLNCNPTGDFAHNPEPLPANLKDLCETVVREKADLGVSVDPDVDRLAFICENGEPFVEEYTLVAVADYLLDEAVKNQADAFITGEMHYHQYFGYEQQIQICVIGHYQSEQYTAEIFEEIINRECPGVKTCIVETCTNPILYI